MEKLIKKIRIKTKIELVTGLHIGGNSESVEIGGIDNPVITVATKDKQPYIPGSSIKGKMRCLLEQIAGATEVGGGTKEKIEHKSDEIKQIINLFGFAHDNKPSKLIVRDAYLEEESVNLLKNSEYLDMPYTESKWENVIDRVKGTAEHPRQTERVPAGVSFSVEFIINVWDDDNNGKELISLLEKGIKALENDYLGGSGSRGYGQIRFAPLVRYEANEENKWEMKLINQ
jgi:CRISPR-associated protein Csm3